MENHTPTIERQSSRLENVVEETPRAEAHAAQPSVLTQRWAFASKGIFIKGLSWIAAFFMMARMTTFLIQFMAARFLGPTEFGKAHIILALTSIIQVLPMLGFPLALARTGAAAENDLERKRIISTSLILFMIWSALVFGVLGSFSTSASVWNGLGPQSWMLCVGLAFLSSLHLVAGGSLQGLLRFKQRGIAEALYAIIAITALMLFYRWDLLSYKTLIASYVIGLAAASGYGLWKLRDYLRFRFSYETLHKILPFAVLGTVSTLSLALVQAPGRITLFHLDSAKAAGVYSAYFMATAQISLALVNIFHAVLIPLSSRAQGQRDAWKALKNVTPVHIAALAAGFGLIAWLAFSFMGRSYPMRWVWLIPFAASATLILIHGVIAAVFAARDLRGLYISVGGSLTAGLGNFLLNLLLTPTWGVTGAAISLTLGYSAGLAWYFFHYPKAEVDP